MSTIPDRASTPEQKRAIIERLYALWLRNPGLRLGQLFEDAAASHLFYYIEDEALLDLLEAWAREKKV